MYSKSQKVILKIKVNQKRARKKDPQMHQSGQNIKNKRKEKVKNNMQQEY